MKALHILLAEDNPGDVMLIRLALEAHHIPHKLSVVEDGAQAIAFVAQMGKPGGPPCPDLMLLDLNLPKADGTKVLSEFRRHPECAHTPVIVISSSDAPADRRRVAELGISRYFMKTADLAEYLKIGQAVLDAVQLKAA
jgi:CheY-like chemotaxis protein